MPPYAQRGVTVVGGTRVHDPDTLLTLLAEGGSGYHFFEKTVERVTLRVSQGQ
ncbi:Rossmann-like domain-containing protein [Paracandidimonas soli]